MCQDVQKADSGQTWYQQVFEGLGINPIDTFVTFLTFIIMWSLWSLCAYHAFLLYIGQTTTEHLRKVFADRPNPYNQGLLGNCTRICCQSSNVGSASVKRESAIDITSASVVERAVAPWRLDNHIRGNQVFGPARTSIPPEVLRDWSTSPEKSASTNSNNLKSCGGSWTLATRHCSFDDSM